MDFSDSRFRHFIALVTFERKSDDAGILQPDEQGACGWMGARTSSEDALSDVFAAELAELGLRLLEIDDVIEVGSLEEAKAYDEHLASNMATWEEEKRTVWGTLHCYLADGEG